MNRTLLSTTLLERMAHDIRGPAGVLQFLLDELATASAEDSGAAVSAELLARSRRSLERLLRVADRLTRVAELESVDVALSTERIELGGLLRESIASARTVEPAAVIAVETMFGERPIFVEVDAARLSTALADVFSTYLRRARGRMAISIEVEPRLRLIIGHDGVRTQAEPDRFADLPLALLRVLVQRHGWQIENEETAPNANGLIEGGRLSLYFSESAAR